MSLFSMRFFMAREELTPSKPNESREIMAIDLKEVSVAQATSKARATTDVAMGEFLISDPQPGAPAPVLRIAGPSASPSETVQESAPIAGSPQRPLEFTGDVGNWKVQTPTSKGAEGEVTKARKRGGFFSALFGGGRKGVRTVECSSRPVGGVCAGTALALTEARNNQVETPRSTKVAAEYAPPTLGVVAQLVKVAGGHNEMHVAQGLVEICYTVAFFERQQEYYDRVEQTLQRSSLQSTEVLRAKVPSMLRSVKTALKRPWWQLQVEMILGAHRYTVTPRAP